MPEWWTYGLSDFLMFSARTYYRMLELHNLAWLPLQPVLLLAGLGIVWCMRATQVWCVRLSLALAGLAWCFVAWAFLWMRYADINWAAGYFALAFALQGVVMVCLAWRTRQARFALDPASRWGVGMAWVALLAYPLLALALGRPAAQSEWFGMAPDPTVLLTLGLLLCQRIPVGQHHRRWSRRLPLLIPLAWCAVSGATSFALSAPEWLLMPVAGVLALAVMGWSRQR